MTEARLVLAMIVRDESTVIERCIESVRPIISGWVIVDTGSTDDTIDRIHAALDGVPGELHRRPWVDFGHNRTELLELAKDHGTHLLLLDADMTIRIDGDLPRLDADAHALFHDATPAYWNPRVLRSDLAWKFVGATHEYLSCETDFTTGRITELVVEDHADGGSRGNKLARDRALLEAALIDDPDDVRAVFYLAQTRRDMGHIEDAIELYRRRLAMGGWEEEVFYAQLQIGSLLARSDADAAIIELLAAWNLRPSRAEPLYELARIHRLRGQYPLTRMYAETGLALGPTSDSAFVDTGAQRWGLRFEAAIAAFHLGDIEHALEENDRLLAGGVPRAIEPWVRANRSWCLRALGRPEPDTAARLPLGDVSVALTDLAHDVRFIPIEHQVDPGWSTFNPSIANDPAGGFAMNIRSSNYVMTEEGRYDFPTEDGDGTIRTVNHLVRLDADLSIVGCTRLPMQPDGAPVHGSRVHGCEDLRLIAVGDRWAATATVRDRNMFERCDIAMLEFDTLEAAPEASLRVLPGPDPSRHEKNWMPFVIDGELHLLYLCSPTIVLRPKSSDGLDIVSTTAGPPGADRWRGGSTGVPHGDGFLFMIHEVTLPAGRRLYAHRFIRMDRVDGRWTITAMTQPFHLIEAGVEFCAGMAIDGDHLIASFGVRDAEAWLMRLPIASVDELLVELVV